LYSKAAVIGPGFTRAKCKDFALMIALSAREGFVKHTVNPPARGRSEDPPGTHRSRSGPATVI
jgi:hypothetical protein